MMGKERKLRRPSNSNPKKRKPVPILDHIAVITVDPPMFQCEICTKKFKTKAHQQYHKFCKTGDTPFKCKVCGKGIIAKSHYEYHLRKHTGELPYVCKICNRRFINKGKLNRHMRSHTGEKRFVCQKCNRKFANSQALKTHTYTHTGERPFLCTKCPQQFIALTNLKKHLVTHSGDKDFLCNYCGKSFFHKDSLDVHLTTHSSTPRPHICGQCGRAFGSMKDLNRHCRTHTGERPFQCSMCDVKFSRQDNLTRHIGKVHKLLTSKSKRLGNEANPKFTDSTASKSSAKPKKVKRNGKMRTKLEKVMEEKVYNLGLCGNMNPTLSLVKVTPQNVDEEVNEHVVALPAPGHAMKSCYTSAGPPNDDNDVLDLEARDLENDDENETGFSDYFSHCPINNDYDKLSEIDGRENEACGQEEDYGQVVKATEKEEEKTLDAFPFDRITIAIPQPTTITASISLTEAKNARKKENTEQETILEEKVFNSRPFENETLVLSAVKVVSRKVGEEENNAKMQDAELDFETAAVSGNEVVTPNTFPFGTVKRLQHAATSLPSAEIETDIQLKRGPRKHFVSRYYFVHKSSGLALSPVKVTSQNICDEVIEGVKAISVEKMADLEGEMGQEENLNDGRHVLITTDLLTAVENETGKKSLDLEIDKRENVKNRMSKDATRSYGKSTSWEAHLEEQNFICEAQEQNENHNRFESNYTIIANDEETPADNFGSFNESASSQSTTVEAENLEKCGGAMKYVSHYYFDYEHPNFVIKKFIPDV